MAVAWKDGEPPLSLDMAWVVAALFDETGDIDGRGSFLAVRDGDRWREAVDYRGLDRNSGQRLLMILYWAPYAVPEAPDPRQEPRDAA